jgi:hypothetical protein
MEIVLNGTLFSLSEVARNEGSVMLQIDERLTGISQGCESHRRNIWVPATANKKRVRSALADHLKAA